MNTLQKSLVFGGMLFGASSFAYANCGFDSGRVSVLANEFPAMHNVVDEAATCAVGGVEFTSNMTAEYRNLQVPGTQSNPAEYTTVIVNNTAIIPLLNEDTIRPLNDLVAKYGKSLKPNQLITVDGNVVAVAFMANAQHFIYRADILKKVGASVPKSYEEVLAAAKKIRAAGILEYPLSGAYKAGWNLATEFVNMYLGHGADLYEAGSAKTKINSKDGVATLKMLKSLTELYESRFPHPRFKRCSRRMGSWECGYDEFLGFDELACSWTTKDRLQQVFENTKVSGPLMVGKLVVRLPRPCGGMAGL